MQPEVQEVSRARFGVFELELRTGELRRSGTLRRLSPQPLKLLVLLLRHPGQLITREEIRQQIWGSETFVDFEHGLNFAIKKIRDTLGDDADSPRYIETLPRRGYRFVATVEWIEAAQDHPGSVAAHAANAGPALEDNAELPGTQPDREGLSHSRKKWIWVVAAVCLLCAGISIWAAAGVGRRLAEALHLRLGQSSPQISSIAVLPLENLSGDPRQEYFSDGLTDTLITYLGQITPLRVISRASVMRYKGGKTPLPQIARELNVDAVVEGTVQREAGRIQISVQLLDARADRHLWASLYEHREGDILGFEKQVALSIAHEISGRVLPAYEARIDGKAQVNPEAYDDYLHGRYLLGLRTGEGETGARAYFDHARRLDPNFAPAYSGLADTHSVGWFINMDLPLAEQYARRAIALDPNLAEGHASLGIAEVYEHRFAEAEKELQRAIELNPNYAMAHHWHSVDLLYTGRPTEALAANDRARQLDPFSLPVNFLRGLILVSMREYDRAAGQFGFASSIDPGSPEPHVELQRIYWTEGRVAEALSEERIAATLSHDSQALSDIEKIAAANKSAGLSAALLKDVEIKQSWYARRQHDATTSFRLTSSEEIAFCHSRLHDRENTLAWLNRFMRDDPVDFPLYVSLPGFAWLHSDAAFQNLLRRAGLVP